MSAPGKIDDWALHAYVDGEVAGEMCADIEALLRNEPELARRVEAWRMQRDALKQAYDGTLAEPLPPSLTATLQRGSGFTAKPYLTMAAALALLLLGGMAGWFLAVDRGPSQTASLARNALAAHAIYAVEVRHPVEVVAAEKDHLQKWLSKRVGIPFKVPDLAREGYTLLGGRLLTAENRPAAQLMYEDAARNRITIFLVAEPENRETALHFELQGQLIACYWQDGELGFAVAGEMDREKMMQLANKIYEEFES